MLTYEHMLTYKEEGSMNITGKDKICNTPCSLTEKVESVREKMVSSEKLLELSDLFKVLGDHTRIRILYALFQSELCVCDLSEVLGMTQSAISHQLRVLRSAKVVKYRREGKKVYYNLDDAHIFSLLDIGMIHVNE